MVEFRFLLRIRDNVAVFNNNNNLLLGNSITRSGLHEGLYNLMYAIIVSNEKRKRYRRKSENTSVYHAITFVIMRIS